MGTQINFFLVLPPDIISKITSRISIKTIIDCMLVCKLWHNVISDPFVAKSNTHFLFYNDDPPKFSMLDDEPLERLIVPEEALMLMKPPSLPSELRHGQQKLVPIDRYRVHSCNPILPGDCVSVLQPSIEQFHSDMYELGFCPSSNQYKLMRFVTFDGKTSELEMYTIGGSGGWRRHIGDVPSQIWNKSEAAIWARGVVHWLLNPKRSVLSTFDLAEEKFGSIPLPRLDDGKVVYKLGYMDECLVVTAGHDPPLSLEIWGARKEYEYGTGWSKNWVVDAADCLDQKTMYPYKLKWLIPRKLSSDGRILLTYLDEEVYCYDPRAKLVTGLVFSNRYYGSRWPCLVAHTATLVSPKELMQGGQRKRKRKLSE